jgi:hypothetical protein
MTYTPKELTWYGVGKETTFGTAVAPVYFVPFKDVKPDNVINYIKDQGIRGAMAETYNVMQGTRKSTFEVSGEVFPDSIGLFALAMLGTDTVAGSSAPYTHKIQLSRTSQPVSLTHSYYDGTNVKSFPGHMAEELSFKWAANAALEYTFKSEGKYFTAGTSATPAPTSTVPILSWQFKATLNNNQTFNLVGFDVTFKRKLYIQFPAYDSQDVNAIIAGGLEVTGKATFDKADDTELNYYLQNTQPSLVLTGTQATTGYQFVIQMSKAAFIKDAITAKEVVQGDTEFECIDNTTDGGPALLQLVNSVASY